MPDLHQPKPCAGVAEEHDLLGHFMAADETFTNMTILHEAIAKDVEQRIATMHLRQPSGRPAACISCSNQLGPVRLQ